MQCIFSTISSSFVWPELSSSSHNSNVDEGPTAQLSISANLSRPSGLMEFPHCFHLPRSLLINKQNKTNNCAKEKKKREREMKITKLAMNTNEPEEPFFQNFMLPYEKI